MANFSFELNKSGVRELMISPEMMDICKGYADAALQKLGDGYEVTTMTGKNRAIASVAAVTKDAYRENLEDNTIIKAVFGS